MTGTEIVAKESRNNEERRVNSETKLKIAVNEEVDQKKRNSSRNTGKNRRVRSNNRTCKDDNISTGRSTYNRRPFLELVLYSNPNQT